MAVKAPTGRTRIIWGEKTLERMNAAMDGEFDAGFLRVPVERGRLRRYIECEKLAMLAICGHLPNVPLYADIGKLAEIAYENVLLAMTLEERNHEHPGGKRETVDASAFGEFERLFHRPNTLAEMYGFVFEVLASAQLDAYERHFAESDEFFNRPTSKILEDAIALKRRQVAWGSKRYAELLGDLPKTKRARSKKRVAAFRRLLIWAGGVDGTVAGPKPYLVEGSLEPVPERVDFDPAFKLDQGYMSNDETIKWREKRPRFDGVDKNGDEISGPGYLLYSYCCEIDVFLQFAMIIYRAPRDLPLSFYRDTTRQLWDEFRHTSMGHRAIRLNDMDPMNLIRPMRWDMWREMSVAENYAWITQTGEACSLAGKHTQRKHYIKERKFHEQTLIEWDISDESQHVRYGARWLREMMKRDDWEGTPKQFVIHSTEKFNWLHYRHMKALDLVPDGMVEPKPYKGCADYDVLGA